MLDHKTEDPGFLMVFMRQVRRELASQNMRRMEPEPPDTNGIKGLNQERTLIMVKLRQRFPADLFGGIRDLKLDQQRNLAVYQ